MSLAAKADGTDLISNGDFSHGHNGWTGDILDDSSDENVQLGGSSSAPNHITIHLSHGRPSTICQRIDPHDSNLIFSITCTFSPDTKFIVSNLVDVSSDIADVKAGRGQISQAGLPSHIQPVIDTSVPMNGITFYMPEVVLVDSSHHEADAHALDLDPATPGILTAQCKRRTDPGKEYKLFIAFPRGDGYVTVTNVSLTPDPSKP